MNPQKRTGLGLSIGRKPFFVVTAALLLLSGASTAAAQSTEFDRWSLSLGVFFADRATNTRLDGEVPGSGTDVDSEHDLGFEKSNSVFRLDGTFRFNETHRVDFSAFDLSRSASKQIAEDIIWDDILFPVDVTIDANLDLKIYKLDYTWSFMRREKGYLGVTGGLYIADIGTSIAADSIGLYSSHATTAPLPVIGLRGRYDFSEKWSFRGSAEIFALAYGDFDGFLYDFYAAVDYQWFEHMAIGLGVNSVRMALGVTKNAFNGDLDWRYIGGLMFFKFDF
jgi:hypothetical protein